jgi:nitrate reductase gamma subunit
MLEQLTELARGPLLALSLLVMAVGLLRALVLAFWELGVGYSKAGDQVFTWPVIIRRSLEWLLPWRYLAREQRKLYNLTSLVFHVGIILVPVFLAGHVALWREELGVGWITLPPLAADVLTWTTMIAIVLLLIGRGTHSGARAISKAQDWLLPILCFVPFASGFMVAHPAWSPMSPQVTYLVHMLSAELLLILVPFTKLVHIVLFWVGRTSTELGWRFTPGAGHRVRQVLGKEGQGV